MTEQIKAECDSPKRCPICNGTGNVPRGFYHQTGGDWTTTDATPEPCRSCSGGIVWSQGFIVELADGGPWLKNDLTITMDWEDRGVWRERIDAELAITQSLSLGNRTKIQ